MGFAVGDQTGHALMALAGADGDAYEQRLVTTPALMKARRVHLPMTHLSGAAAGSKVATASASWGFATRLMARRRPYMPQRQMLPFMAALMAASGGVRGEQGDGGHDLTGLAVAALWDLLRDPGFLNGVEAIVAADIRSW